MTSLPHPSSPATAGPTLPSRRGWPRARVWNVLFRTVHIAATGLLLGGHAFGAQPAQLYLLLATAVATGLALIGLELATTPGWAYQGCALFVYAKLALVCLVPVAWAYRVPILLGVVVLASVGSHAPRSLRHYSIREKRVMIGPTSSV